MRTQVTAHHVQRMREALEFLCDDVGAACVSLVVQFDLRQQRLVHDLVELAAADRK
jgi:hypothetical protein